MVPEKSGVPVLSGLLALGPDRRKGKYSKQTLKMSITFQSNDLLFMEVLSDALKNNKENYYIIN